MAMIYCPMCGRAISATAPVCPGCGHPMVAGGVRATAFELREKQWHPGVAAVLSFLIPGLGQIYKGQIANGLVWFVLTGLGYFFFVIPGIVLHVCCIFGAAMGNPYRSR